MKISQICIHRQDLIFADVRFVNILLETDVSPQDSGLDFSNRCDI